MKKRMIILVMICSFVMIIGGIILFLHDQNSNQKEVTRILLLTENQTKKESKFKSKGSTLEKPNIILNPYGISPLTALIIFETEDEVKPIVTIVGKDEKTTYTHTFEKNKIHFLTIYRLYPNKNNEIKIRIGNTTKSIWIQTEKLPEDFILPTDVYANKDLLDQELYFFTPFSKGYTCAYDMNGDVRWYLTENMIWNIEPLKNGHLLLSTERLVNAPYYNTGLYEIDLLGKIYMEYSLEGGYHHDYEELPNGNLLVASNQFHNEKGTVEDVIVEIDRKTGKILKQIDLKDILKMEDGKSENWSEYDWFHNNSVWYDEKTNSITLSGRHQDAVINIDYDTLKLNWIIGDPTNWSKEYQKYFFKPLGDDFEWQWSQHAAMITPEGYVFILDNGNNKSKMKEEYVEASNSYTRGVMYQIDTENMTIKQVWQYGKERESEFYSPYISDVDYLNQNHYIVHSGGIVYVDGKNSNQPAGFSENTTLESDTVELMNDEVIFEIKLPTNNYRVEKMNLYQEEEEYHIQKVKRVGTLGKTPIEKTKFTPYMKSFEIDKNYKSHKIEISQEIDRLVVKGKFKKQNQVKIVLYQDLKSQYYQVRVSKKTYTAMCVDIFTEEEQEDGIVVTKYINQEGLHGKYSIYIEIDGILYNTEQMVKF